MNTTTQTASRIWLLNEMISTYEGLIAQWDGKSEWAGEQVCFARYDELRAELAALEAA